MTYEYQCKSCNHRWETEQKITEEPMKNCPECKKETALRLVSGGTAVIYKGAGWYATGGY